MNFEFLLQVRLQIYLHTYLFRQILSSIIQELWHDRQTNAQGVACSDPLVASYLIRSEPARPHCHTLSSRASPCTCTQIENPKDRYVRVGWISYQAPVLPPRLPGVATPIDLLLFFFSFHVAQSLSRYYKYDLMEYLKLFKRQTKILPAATNETGLLQHPIRS